MKSVSISGSIRENVGKKDAKEQRKRGMIPAVIYGGEKQIPILVSENSMKAVIYTPEVMYVNLNIEGKIHDATIQELQFHPVTDRLLHVDFLESVPNRPITISIPIKIKGTAPGVLKGGKLSKKIRKIKVRGLLENIPEFISVDVSKLDIMDSICAEEIKVDNVELMEAPSMVIVSVMTSRNVSDDEVEGETETEAGSDATPTVKAASTK